MRHLAALGLLVPSLCWAQLTPQEAISVQHISAVTFAPDGQHVAFTVEGSSKGKGSPRDIWLWNGSGDATAFTRDGTSFGAEWSPDGRRLAYLSTPNGVPQLYIGSVANGSASPVTHLPSGVKAFRWSPDGKKIAFLATDPDTISQQDPRQNPLIIRVVSGTDLPMLLWMIDLTTGSERRITAGSFDVSELSWKADGSGFIVLASRRLDPEHAAQRIYSVDASSGAYQQLFDPKTAIEQIELSPDGRSITYVGPHGDGITPSDLYILPSGGGAPRDLTAPIDRPVDRYHWKDNSTLVAAIGFGFVDRLYTVSTVGRAAPVEGFSADPEAFEQSRSGEIAFVKESPSDPPELWISKEDGSGARAITHLNASWSAVPRAKGQIIRYASFDGTLIEGELLRPSGTTDARLPTVFWAHGGPIGRWQNRFDSEGQFLASHGYAVFYPNIRGSTGYGQHFIDQIRSRALGGTGWADRPVEDIEAGADALVQRGIADNDRLGIGGWSAGGYFTGLAVTRSHRFKAGVAGSGLYDMLNDLGTEIAAFVASDRWAYGNFFDPATQRELRGDSPIATVSQSQTPVLLLHGELDQTDTIGQLYEFFRGLRSYGAPVQLVVYPHEGHVFQQQAHIIDQMNRTLIWFDHYLKPPAKAVAVNHPH
jgi:dipeptidyl aminopeptidase/acylaminoacyl peptidase